ncbi:hypothetical protein ACTUM3_15480, partial [Listeria monocytogenes]
MGPHVAEERQNGHVTQRRWHVRLRVLLADEPALIGGELEVSWGVNRCLHVVVSLALADAGEVVLPQR